MRIVATLTIVGALVAAVVWFVRRRNDRVEEVWRSFARKHGFAVGDRDSARGTLVELDGEFDGESVHLEIAQGRGDRAVYWTELDSRVPIGLEMFDESLFHLFGKLFGRQDIDTGRAPIDETFIVRGPDPEAVRRYLDDPDAAEALAALADLAGEVHLEQGRLKATNHRVIDDPEELEQIASTMARCASALETRHLEADDESRSAAPEKTERDLESHDSTW